jgi:glycosyltransferase involved in cell wall biosynthesis
MTRPVVAFVGHVAEFGGGERSLLEVATRLERCRVVVLLGTDGPLAEHLRTAGVDVEIVPLDPAVAAARRRTGIRGGVPAARLRSWGVRLRARLEADGASVVVANTLKAGIALGLARPNTRFVWSLRDRLAPDYLGRGPLLVAHTAVRLAPDLVVANSHATAATCPRRVPVVVIPPSVTPPVVRVGAAGAPLRVAVLGRLAPWKGQHHALAAFARAFGEGDETLVFVGGPLFGEDGYERQLRAQAAPLGDRVRFTGHVGDVGPALDGVHVVVHASRLPEPFGRVVIEGMGAGLAVVAMAAGGPTEIVTDGVDGLLIDPDDERALADVLRRLAADPLLRERLGQSGRHTAEAFLPDRLTDRWYAALLGAAIPQGVAP